MSVKKEVLLVSSIDNNYVLPYLTMIFSAHKNSRNHMRFLLAYRETTLSPSNRELINKVCKFLSINLEMVQLDSARKFSPYFHVSENTYDRLLIPSIIKQNFFWLDADLVLLPGWDDLFLMDFGSAPLAACKDTGIVSNNDNAALIVAGDKYFNAGLMWINFGHWQEYEVDLKWREAYEQRGKHGFIWVEQCILNYLFGRDYYELPHEYNFQWGGTPAFWPRVIHYTGDLKPWNTATGWKFRTESTEFKFLNYLIWHNILKQLLTEFNSDTNIFEEIRNKYNSTLIPQRRKEKIAVTLERTLFR